MKKSILPIILLIMSVSLVSAAGIGDLLDQIDESTVILSAVFIISFALIFFALSRRLLKTNITIATVLSITAAFLITFFLNKTGFDISGLFYNIGISEEILMIVLPIIIIAGMIFVIIKLRSGSFLVFGGLLILLSFFTYEKTFPIVLGVISLIVGLVLLGRKKKRGLDNNFTDKNYPIEEMMSG